MSDCVLKVRRLTRSPARIRGDWAPCVIAFSAAALLFAAEVLFASGASAQKRAPETPERLLPQSITIEARSIDTFSRTNLLRTRFGAMDFLGGLVLSAPIAGFGGWSDLAIDTGGKRVAMVSDDGHWLTADIAYRGSKPMALENARMGPLRARSGRVLGGKKESDAEGMALVAGTLAGGEVLISFERIHRLGRFRIGKDGITGPTAYIALPKEATQLGKNGGLEAVAALKAGPLAGSVVVFAERRRKRDADRPGRPGWILRNDSAQSFTVEDRGGLDISGAVGLDDGSVLLLERRFRWTEGLNIRVRRFAAQDIKPGAVLSGDVLLEADLGYEIDNLEGITAHRGTDGRIVVTLVSDDNFNRLLQRTVLLQFAIAQ